MTNVITSCTSCTRRLEFDAAHVVSGHGGKCKHLHGHRYAVEVTVTAPLDTLGMVVDFSVVKDKVGAWIDNNLDHNIILRRDHPLVRLGLQIGWGVDGVFAGKAPYLMDDNPTAENLARLLLEKAQVCLAPLVVECVTVYETPNCFATAYVPQIVGVHYPESDPSEFNP